MQVKFVKAEMRSDFITTFWFDPERPLDHVAGQFIELTVPHDEPDDRGTKRWFTISSSPTEPLIGITTKFDPERSSSFKQALRNLRPGDTVTMSDAMGDFVLPKQTETPLIFIAGGIGITPYASMLDWLRTSGQVRPIKLLYGVRDEDDIIFRQTLKDAGIHTTFVVENPSDAWGGERGRITAELVLGLERPSADTLIYASGPEPMIESLVNDIKKRGINSHQIVTDFFPNYTHF